MVVFKSRKVPQLCYTSRYLCKSKAIYSRMPFATLWAHARKWCGKSICGRLRFPKKESCMGPMAMRHSCPPIELRSPCGAASKSYCIVVASRHRKPCKTLLRCCSHHCERGAYKASDLERQIENRINKLNLSAHATMIACTSISAWVSPASPNRT